MRKGFDYPGVAIGFMCHDGTGRYLLQKRGANCRDEQGRWDTGGGGLEFGETIEETLRKEVAEEYTTVPLQVEFLGYRDVHREHEGEKTHWVSLDFKVLVDPTTVTNGEPHKFDEIGWFTLDTFPEPLHSVLPVSLESYKDRL